MLSNSDYMDKLISFVMSVNYCTFRKPDINKIYLTYNVPPITAILGVLGSIIGLKGYRANNSTKELPDFFIKFNDLKLGIKPLQVNISKQNITYNNYNGYGQDNSNQIINEQVISSKDDYLSWKIYVLGDFSNEDYKKLLLNLNNNLTVFTPYLGKNEFRCQINDFLEHDFVEIKDYSKAMLVNSLVLKESIYDNEIKSTEKEIDLFNFVVPEPEYYIEENIPVGFNKYGKYIIKNSVFTNKVLKIKDSTLGKVIHCDDNNIFLFKVFGD